MPRYELVEGTSSKFWEIEIAGTGAGTRMTTRWGRIGTAGQEKTKDFASPEKAQAEHDALVREKTGKGYRETGAASAPAVPRPAPAAVIPPPPPPVAAAPEPEPEPVAPAAVAGGEEPAIAWTPDLRSLVLPRRGGEVLPVRSDPAAAWMHMRERFAANAQGWKASRSMSDDLGPVLRGVVRKLEYDGAGLPPTADPEIEGALLAVLSVGDFWQKPPLDDEIVTLWTATGGLAFAVEALQASLGFQAVTQHGATVLWLVRKSTGGGLGEGRHWWHLRCRLAAADAAEYSGALDTARRLRAGAPLEQGVLLAYLFPETGWAEDDARAFLKRSGGSEGVSGVLIPAVCDPGLVNELLESGGSGFSPRPLSGVSDASRQFLLTLVDTLGTAAAGPLFKCLDKSGSTDHRQTVLQVLSILHAPEMVEGLAARAEARDVAAVLASFLESSPRLALPALAVRGSRNGVLATALLSQAVRRNPGLARELLPGLPDAARRTVEALLGKAELPPEAAPADLPPVLASPPEQRKGRRKSPAFWQPAGFARPLLRGRSAALPLSAVETLGTLLALSSLDEPYAGLEEVKAACDPPSLAAFAWDLFAAWLISEAASKEAWALRSLGHFGDDACARRLAVMIREWPGESAHARAVTGLDVLRAIGTDVALMHLHGISQKVKFKGLQDKAKEKIEEIAEQRGLTPEDLADRLVPDVGLGADGSLLLDFGPRSFRVAFDESLKPFLRDADGKRLPDLPKPGKADEAEKAQQAQEVWKTLKKDAKAVAVHQILRLELAMCGRRLWEPDVFRAFFLEHPLVRHLVRRLVWGVWDAEGSLAGTFRVSEDDSLADAADDVWEMPDGIRVGIVHRLDMTDELAARWGEVLSDYEILQPFAQIGREVLAITEEERGARELRRVEGVTVPTGKVLGLVDRRGWRRGPPQDAGIIGWFTKPLPGGEHEAWLTLDPGVVVGMVMELPEQKLGTVTIERVGSWDNQGGVAFGRLDPIVFSELVRDLESLRE
jgi:predicted DNA-binding WGR domain protein